MKQHDLNTMSITDLLSLYHTINNDLIQVVATISERTGANAEDGETDETNENKEN